MTEFVCWRCIKREVDTPGMECDRCFASEDRKSRRLASPTRSTETHERTHEKHRAPWSDAVSDDVAYRRWLDASA